jgi:hypothetical protein
VCSHALYSGRKDAMQRQSFSPPFPPPFSPLFTNIRCTLRRCFRGAKTPCSARVSYLSGCRSASLSVCVSCAVKSAGTEARRVHQRRYLRCLFESMCCILSAEHVLDIKRMCSVCPRIDTASAESCASASWWRPPERLAVL